jgi:hypothetical protein
VAVRGVRVVGAALGAALAAATAGCAPAPEVVAGSPAPLTPAATTPATATTTATAPTGSAPATSPSTAPTPPRSRPAPVLPARYETLELTAYGVTLRMPVPAGWRRTRTALGYDLGDPSETLLLRVNVTAREPGRTVRQSWEAAEASLALAGYRRLDVRDVPGYFDEALDWTFVFDRDGEQRQVVDRLLVSGQVGVAVYFSARRADFPRLLPVWDRAIDNLALS